MRSKVTKWYRKPRTTAEMRANQGEYARAKRRPRNLPSSYDDQPYRNTNSWKDKRKTQYRVGGRGAKHELFFTELSWREQYDLEEFLKDQDIPHCIETVRESYMRRYVQTTQRVKSAYVPYFGYSWPPKDRHQSGWHWTYRWEDLDESIVTYHKASKITGYVIRWWHDRDIGIDRILNRVRY